MKPFTTLVGGLVLTTALASSAYADDIKTFHNRAAFLAATAATSATGPLPDVGIILDANVSPPVSSYPLGSLTFGLTFGSDNVFMGTAGTPALPDWYPGTPGNDMAFGWERFEVATSGPVYSFGFDIVEPDATMPPFGGIPEESTYEFVLYNGSVLVGHVLFDGASIPNDVETFIGIWSDKPFDRVVINDISGSDDDEFLGEFYTGTVAFGCTMNVGLSYSGGTFRMNLELGTTTPRTWNLWLVYGANNQVRLASVPVPALPSAVSFPVSFAMPPLGNVGVLTTLASASEGIACSDYKTVSTTP
jgi:hypothetical protein